MKNKLLQIIKKYGVRNQLRKLNEEVFELIEAIRDYEEDYTRVDLKEHVIEEIGDVLNVVEQFLYYYEIDINDVIESKHKKVDRQLKRMEEE